MHSLNLSTLHQPHLGYLTGCRYAVLIRLAAVAKHGPLAMVGLVLMKLRHNLTGRALEALAGIDAVTLSRYVRKVTALLGTLPLRMQQPQGFLLVDTTSVRVGSSAPSSYSGHKHQRCAKAQVIADEAGFVQHSGAAWPGSVHDKTVYNKERVSLGEALGTLILADKAYVGAFNEGEGQLRPIKRGKRAAKLPAAQAFNAELSRRRTRAKQASNTSSRASRPSGSCKASSRTGANSSAQCFEPSPWFTVSTAWRRLRQDEPLKLRGSEGSADGRRNYETALDKEPPREGGS